MFLTNKQIGEVAVLCQKFCKDTQMLIVCLKDNDEKLISKLKADLEEKYQQILNITSSGE